MTMNDLEEQIADILGLEKEDHEWRLITRDDNGDKLEFVDYTNEVLELVDLFEQLLKESSI